MPKGTSLKDSSSPGNAEAGPKTGILRENLFGNEFMASMSAKLSSLPLPRFSREKVVTEVRQDLEMRGAREDVTRRMVRASQDPIDRRGTKGSWLEATLGD